MKASVVDRTGARQLPGSVIRPAADRNENFGTDRATEAPHHIITLTMTPPRRRSKYARQPPPLPLPRLPDDLIRAVGAFLSGPDALALARTCRTVSWVGWIRARFVPRWRRDRHPRIRGSASA